MHTTIGLALAATLFAVILDCDETFNYWEPLHMLLYGDGFKPWEYDSKYALRPYAFLYLLYFPAKLLSLAGLSKRMVFNGCRFMLALFNFWSLEQLCECYGIEKWALLVPGIFSQSSAFLPNSVACSLCALFLSHWKQRQTNRALLILALTTFLTWPYAAIFYAPFVVYVNDGKHASLSIQFRRYLLVALISLVYIVIPVAVVDFYWYGKVTVTWLNAVLYNVFGGNDELFGTESRLFYLLNGLLNYNFLFLLPIAALNARKIESNSLIIAMGLLSWRSHKEERFLFPVIPLLLTRFKRFSHYSTLKCLMVPLCILRLITIKKYYGGPEKLFQELNRSDVVCLKDQWYRFPSHFLLHDSSKVGFLESMDFQGALPQYYSESNSLYNNLNVRSPTQFAPVDQCTKYIGTKLEFQDKKMLKCVALMDSRKTSAPYRWLFIPFPANKIGWEELCIFENV